jgi:hypothetical protein
LPLPPVRACTPVYDDLDVRVVLVVLDEPLIELVLELRRYDAIDHCIAL